MSAPPLETLQSSLAGLLAAERRLRGRDHAPGELSVAHVRSLRALAAGPLTAGELARSAQLGPASVTAMVDHLERDGIVERTRSTADRRVCHIALTELGRARLREKTARWNVRWADRLGRYAPEELQIAARILDDVTGLLDTVLAEREAEREAERQAVA